MGTHSWTSRAYDSAGNKTSSAPIVVSVNIEGGTSLDTPIDPNDPSNPIEREPASDGQLQTIDKIGFCGTIANSNHDGGPSGGSASAAGILSWFLPFMMMGLIYAQRIISLSRLNSMGHQGC